ncbi:hypothetical protein IFVP182_C2120136 [Vibrio parahaemolyticus]
MTSFHSFRIWFSLYVTGVTGHQLSINCSVKQGKENDYPSRWKSINEFEEQITSMLFYEVVLKGVMTK